MGGLRLASEVSCCCGKLFIVLNNLRVEAALHKKKGDVRYDQHREAAGYILTS